MKIYYATQVQVAPPTIALFVNHPDYVDASYQRYVVNRFRELLPYPEVPIRLLIRPRGFSAIALHLDDTDCASSVLKGEGFKLLSQDDISR